MNAVHQISLESSDFDNDCLTGTKQEMNHGSEYNGDDHSISDASDSSPSPSSPSSRNESNSSPAFDRSKYSMEDLIKAQRRSKKICKRMEEREELRLAALAEKLFASDDEEDMGDGSDSYKGAREVDDDYVDNDDQDEDEKDESAGDGKSKKCKQEDITIAENEAAKKNKKRPSWSALARISKLLNANKDHNHDGFSTKRKRDAEYADNTAIPNNKKQRIGDSEDGNSVDGIDRVIEIPIYRKGQMYGKKTEKTTKNGPSVSTTATTTAFATANQNQQGPLSVPHQQNMPPPPPPPQQPPYPCPPNMRHAQANFSKAQYPTAPNPNPNLRQAQHQHQHQHPANYSRAHPQFSQRISQHPANYTHPQFSQRTGKAQHPANYSHSHSHPHSQPQFSSPPQNRGPPNPYLQNRNRNYSNNSNVNVNVNSNVNSNINAHNRMGQNINTATTANPNKIHTNQKHANSNDDRNQFIRQECIKEHKILTAQMNVLLAKIDARNPNTNHAKRRIEIQALRQECILLQQRMQALRNINQSSFQGMYNPQQVSAANGNPSNSGHRSTNLPVSGTLRGRVGGNQQSNGWNQMNVGSLPVANGGRFAGAEAINANRTMAAGPQVQNSLPLRNSQNGAISNHTHGRGVISNHTNGTIDAKAPNGTARPIQPNFFHKNHDNVENSPSSAGGKADSPSTLNTQVQNSLPLRNSQNGAISNHTNGRGVISNHTNGPIDAKAPNGIARPVQPMFFQQTHDNVENNPSSAEGKADSTSTLNTQVQNSLPLRNSQNGAISNHTNGRGVISNYANGPIDQSSFQGMHAMPNPQQFSASNGNPSNSGHRSTNLPVGDTLRGRVGRKQQTNRWNQMNVGALPVANGGRFAGAEAINANRTMAAGPHIQNSSPLRNSQNGAISNHTNGRGVISNHTNGHGVISNYTNGTIDAEAPNGTTRPVQPNFFHQNHDNVEKSPSSAERKADSPSTLNTQVQNSLPLRNSQNGAISNHTNGRGGTNKYTNGLIDAKAPNGTARPVQPMFFQQNHDNVENSPSSAEGKADSPSTLNIGIEFNLSAVPAPSQDKIVTTKEVATSVRLALSRDFEVLSAPAPNSKLGIIFGKDEKSSEFFVKYISKESAFAGRVSVGDIVTHLNSKELKGMELDKVEELVEMEVNKELQISVKKNRKIPCADPASSLSSPDGFEQETRVDLERANEKSSIDQNLPKSDLIRDKRSKASAQTDSNIDEIISMSSPVPSSGKIGIVILQNTKPLEYFIHSVSKESPFKGKVKIGDILTHFNSNEVKGLSCDEIERLVASNTEKEFRIVVKRKKQTSSGGLQNDKTVREEASATSYQAQGNSKIAKQSNKTTPTPLLSNPDRVDICNVLNIASEDGMLSMSSPVPSDGRLGMMLQRDEHSLEYVIKGVIRDSVFAEKVNVGDILKRFNSIEFKGMDPVKVQQIIAGNTENEFRIVIKKTSARTPINHVMVATGLSEDTEIQSASVTNGNNVKIQAEETDEENSKIEKKNGQAKYITAPVPPTGRFGIMLHHERVRSGYAIKDVVAGSAFSGKVNIGDILTHFNSIPLKEVNEEELAELVSRSSTQKEFCIVIEKNSEYDTNPSSSILDSTKIANNDQVVNATCKNIAKDRSDLESLSSPNLLMESNKGGSLPVVPVLPRVETLSAPVPPNNCRLGIMLNYERVRSRYVVKDVLAGSPFIGKVKIGDILTHFNSIPLKEANEKELSELVSRSSNQKEFCIVVERNSAYDSNASTSVSDGSKTANDQATNVMINDIAKDRTDVDASSSRNHAAANTKEVNLPSRKISMDEQPRVMSLSAPVPPHGKLGILLGHKRMLSGYVIKKVFSGSAFREVVKIGDILTHFNSVPLKEIELQEVVKMVASSSTQKEFRIVIERNSEHDKNSSLSSPDSSKNTNGDQVASVTNANATKDRSDLEGPSSPNLTAETTIGGNRPVGAALMDERCNVETLSAPVPPNGKLGIRLKKDSKSSEYYIKKVFTGSAFSGQVKIGDILTHFNSIALRGISTNELGVLVKPSGENLFQITVKRCTGCE